MSDFLFKLSLLAKHLSKYYLKNKNGENFVERFELIFLNFPLSKRNRILKIDPNCWNHHFCCCLKVAIVILRHALTWFLDINKQMNKQFCCRETSFILCLVSVLIFIIFTEWVSIFGIHWVLISIIQDTVNCIQDLIKNAIFVDICN